MTDYVLLATRYDRAVTRDEKGFALTTERLYAGAVISDLDEAEARRLLAADAIAAVATVDDATDHGEANGDDALDVVPPTPDPTVGGPVVPPAADEAPVKPNKTAPVKAWEDYAVALREFTGGAQGLTREDAEAATKQDLVELFA